jgi:GPI mannosyltransferase 3
LGLAEKMMPPRNPALLLGLLVGFRLINTFLIRTFFQPDEYFQSLEPAWQRAFGPDSGAFTTWVWWPPSIVLPGNVTDSGGQEWNHQLRSSLHPWLFAGVYKFADYVAGLLSLDHEGRSSVLIAAPKCAQAVFAALGDWFTWRLAGQIYGHESTAALAAVSFPTR